MQRITIPMKMGNYYYLWNIKKISTFVENEYEQQFIQLHIRYSRQ